MCCGRSRRSACSAGRAACRRIPTAQGVSLRGVGPSGVSRTLVLLDGVPFNDPFGGWVYWTRVPLESADRIEVVDGSGSSLYGNYAMGGVINIITAPPSRRTLELKPQYGNRNSPKVDVLGSDVWGKLGVVVDGSAFSTDGFPDRRRERARPGGQQGVGRFPHREHAARLQPDRPRGRILPRRLLPRAAEQREGEHDRRGRRGERHDLDIRQRRRADPAAGPEHARGAALHRRRAVPQQLPRGARRRTRRAASAA